ncbi:ABC-F family ATP-binding cassette domain-containing protein [Agrococcus sp. SGAir0287]|uniref:ABC-F family ATP-binding cassette domain-containing protein n=1 Tax=Agrococcus sp. SGAir0287 TaxID=2070347 RepID=UPI0010CCB582|nr:ABC-F family ATP-binding cassette domain-containing protein [Agrococcus sp. SGAir0287]QCR19828.1 ABC transporter ATP-binding protein [Agrococcus sp. SGAir0287]
MAHLLGAERIRLAHPNRVVFESVSLGLDDGDRIGIVGRNGDGKSTLLRLLAGTLQPDDGRVTHRGGLRVGMLDQRDVLDHEGTVGATIVGDREEHEWAGDARIREIVAGLAGDVPWDATIASLSGGQRRRVALARLLAGDWDVLLLDEPTNHLDVQGIAWLADHLVRRLGSGRGALAVVTHDRWFLDAVCTDTWEVHDGIVEPFEGGYAAYVLQRVERDRMARVTEAKRQSLMRKELAWLRRGAPARTSKPKFRIDAATQLIEDVPEPRDRVALAQLAVTRLGKDVVDLRDVSVSFGERQVLDDVTWLIAPGERTGILGRNGAGKSTLLQLVAGTIQPTSGRVKRGATVKVAQLSQELAELRDVEHEPVRTVIGRLRTSYGSGSEELTPGQLLERLGFQSDELSTPIRDLSGGQRRRLQLLLILLDEPNVLILDEPTNDLDTDMLAALEDLLDSWAGCLIVVSHDRYLIERVTDQQRAVVDGRLQHLPGGVDQYLAIEAEAASQRGRAATPLDAQGSAPATQRLSGAERRQLELEVRSLERRVQKATEQREAMLAAFAVVDQGDYDRLLEMQRELAEVEERLAELEEAWLEAADRLEG